MFSNVLAQFYAICSPAVGPGDDENTASTVTKHPPFDLMGNPIYSNAASTHAFWASNSSPSFTYRAVPWIS